MKPSPIRIVHVIRQFHPGVGGMENFVEQLALRQIELGRSVSVLTLDRLFDDPLDRRLATVDSHRGIAIKRIAFAGSRRYPIAPGVLTAIRDADLVHVHGVDFFCDFLAATRWLHRKPMVLTTHGGFFHTRFASKLKQVYFRTATRLSLTRYAAVIACSEEDERRFFTIAPSRLSLIPNPVDVDKFAGLADPASQQIIYFGRLAPNKELPRLLAWFSGLCAAGRDWRLIIAGAPMGVDLSDLTRRAAELGIEDRVKVEATPSDARLRDLIASSSVYACASSYEGFGLAAVEAASAGLLLLLSDIPPFRRSIERLGYGMIVDFEDPGEWPSTYRAFDRGIANFRARMTTDKVAEAVEPFSWPRAIRSFETIYDRLLGHHRRRIGKVLIDVTDGAAARSAILAKAAARQPLLATFCNAHTVNLAQHDPALRDALAHAVVLNDGVGVDLASRALFGARFPENLNGTDFVPSLFETDKELRIFLLGAKEGVAEAAAAKLTTRYPQAVVTGVRHGFFQDEESEEIIAQIKASEPDLVLIALGQPRQEIWAARHVDALGVPAICVGALFDFLAGQVVRAYPAMRKLRLEWAFRLAQEPRRLASRYLLGNVAFLTRTVWQLWSNARL